MFLMTQGENYPSEHLPWIRQRLTDATDEHMSRLHLMSKKSPVVALVLSLLLGSWGVDSMYVGDVGLGILKLITCGGMGLWTIIDWFLIMGVARNKNFENFLYIMRY